MARILAIVWSPSPSARPLAPWFPFILVPSTLPSSSSLRIFVGNVLLWVSWLVLPYPFRCVSSCFPSRLFLTTLLTIINSLPPHHSHFLSSSPLCVSQEYWMSLSHIWYILTSLFIFLFYFLHPALPLNISSKQARIFWVFSLLNAHCKDHEEIFVQ